MAHLVSKVLVITGRPIVQKSTQIYQKHVKSKRKTTHRYKTGTRFGKAQFRPIVREPGEASRRADGISPPASLESVGDNGGTAGSNAYSVCSRDALHLCSLPLDCRDPRGDRSG